MKDFRKLIIYVVILILSSSLFFTYTSKNTSNISKNQTKEKEDNNQKDNKDGKDNKSATTKTFTISAAGDCTIGWDTNFGYGNRFDKVFKDNGNNYAYFFQNVKDVFSDDDITYVNLEGTFTNETKKVEKKFNFKATPDYVNVLKEGNVEIAGLANNHSYDYGDNGSAETIKTLKENGIDYFGREYFSIKEINGIKVGFFGLIDIDAKKYSEVDKSIKYLKDNDCDLIIAAMHWGIEGDPKQNSKQINMGHYLIDNGVDLVIGTHPHVIQGIEKYHDRYIIYSLANFVFGGNPNPKDKDTFIFKQTFTFVDGKLTPDDNIKIIPASISGSKKKNNYQPVILTGSERNRVMNKIKKNSINVDFNKQEEAN